MKRILALILAMLMLVSFLSCGKEEEGGTSSVSESNASTENSANAESSESSESSETAESSEDKTFAEQFDAEGNYIPLNYEDMKIMKLTQWDMCEGIVDSKHSEKLFRRKAKKTMENIAEGGFNTVLLQIRPFADSYYQSEYYPLSYFVTGSYAKQEVKYDVVSIFIEEAHKLGLSIHAWINPMRCMTRSEIESITGEWAITDWYSHMGDGGEYSEYMFSGTDAGGTTRLYLNPAYEEVRQLIINGIDEILTNYKVDGVFMDDYFYPEEVKSNTTIDANAFANRTDDSAFVFEFRCNNVNTLIRGIYAKVKEHGEDIIYGISPNGHITHAYGAECADIYTWCATEGYCDIMYPQFYYGMLHGQVSISELMKQWHEVLKVDSIKLVPILTLHKAGTTDTWAINDDAKEEWKTYNDVLLMSMTYLLLNPYRDIDGIGFFCYQYFYGDESKNTAVKAERENYAPIWEEYEKLIGLEVDELAAYYESIGLDLKELGDKWDERLVNTGRFLPMFNIPAESKGE